MANDGDKDLVDDISWKKASARKRKLMLVSRRLLRATESNKLDKYYERNEEDVAVQAEKLKTAGRKQKVQSCSHKSLVESAEETDYLLESLHKLKHWLRRVGKYAQCYSQYCYPGLRTIEYYRKVNKNHERNRVSAPRKPSKHSKPHGDTGNESRERRPLVFVPTKSTASSSISEQGFQTNHFISNETCEEEEVAKYKSSPPKEIHSSIKENEKLLPIKKALNDLDDDPVFSWADCISKRVSDIVSRTISLNFNYDGTIHVTRILKWIYFLFFPALLTLGIHYVVLRRRYKNLSEKLRRIRGENHVLVQEGNKLESTLMTTEKLTRSLLTKESRAQAVAEFTRLSESLMNSKKGINQITTERAALLEELKTARKKRDEARKKFSSLAQGMLDHESCIKS